MKTWLHHRTPERATSGPSPMVFKNIGIHQPIFVILSLEAPCENKLSNVNGRNHPIWQVLDARLVWLAGQSLGQGLDAIVKDQAILVVFPN